MKAFECVGYWWVPGRDAAPAAGTLNVTGDGHIRLSLIGQLAEQPEQVGESRPPVVFGSVDKSPRGNEVTLVDCALIRSSVGTHRGRREEYSAGRAYFGGHLPGGREATFRSCMVQAEGLTAWARPTPGVRSTHLPTSKSQGQEVSVATYRVPVFPTGRVGDAEVTLNYGVSSKSEFHQFTFREEANVLFDFDAPLTAEQINRRFVYPVRNLMTLVSNRAQGVERVSVWSSPNHSDWEANPEVMSVAAQVQPPTGEEENKAVLGFEMLFTLEDVDFSELIGHWLQLSESYADSCNIFFGSEYGPPRYLDMKFTLIAQALTLYFTRTQGGRSLLRQEETRLKAVLGRLQQEDGLWLIDHLDLQPYPTLQTVLQHLMDQHGEAMDPLLSQRRDAFISQSAATLQYIERRTTEGEETVRGASLYWLVQKLRFLLKTCYLAELGFGPQKVAELYQRSALYQHMCILERRRSSAHESNPL